MARTPSEPTRSPLRQFLGDGELGDFLDQLNADPWIGPAAPGDGDLVEWYSSVCLLALARAMGQEPAAQLPLPPLTIKHSTSEKSQKLLTRLWTFRTDMAEPLLKDASAERHQAWQHVCTLIDDELALQWGGRRVRIKKKNPVSDPQGKVARALQKNVPIEKIPAQTGLSRATVYRMLKRKQ